MEADPISDGQLQDEVFSNGEDESVITFETSLHSRSQLLEDMKMKSYNRSVEQMLIYFKHYQQQIMDICKQLDCQVVLGTEKFNIYGRTTQDIERCYSALSQRLLDQISLIRIELKMPRDRYLYTNSPARLKLLKQNRCHLTSYQQSILYLDSDLKTQSELEEIKKKISITTTYRVVYRNFKERQPVYKEIGLYFRKLIEHNSDMFRDMKVEVECSTENEAIHITSSENSSRSAAKNTCKKFIQQTAILLFRTKQKPLLQSLQKYMTDVVKYPWVVGELQNKLYVVITKDSIFNKLIVKSKFQELLGIGKDTVIGMTLLTKHQADLDNRVEMVRGVCNDEGYRLTVETGANCFFTPSIIRGTEVEPEKRQSNFISRVLEMLMKSNEDYEFDLKSLKKQQQEKGQQVQRRPITTFYEEGEYLPLSQTEELRKRFGCDLRMCKIKLNAGYLARYNDMDGTEEKQLLFNVTDGCAPQRTEIVFIDFQKMTGKYFYGRRKTSKGKIMYFPELLVKVVEG